MSAPLFQQRMLLLKPKRHQHTHIIMKFITFIILAALVAMLVCVTSCTPFQREAALDRIKSAGIRVQEAGGKAAAQQALNEAEAALTELEAVPLRENASATELAAWAAAITEGRNQVAELRRRVAEFSFTGK